MSLGWTDEPRYRELFAWKHERNPFGPSLAWVVERGGRVVAVRLFMRWEFRRGGATLRAVRAVDTATHPDHQGRGLFTALTQHAVEACRTDGVAFVFNTPNEQSRPGYLKLGWREVGRLRTAVRPGRPGRSRDDRTKPSPGGALVGADRRRRRHRIVVRRAADAGRRPPRSRRRIARCGRRRTNASPAGATASPTCTTAWSTTETRRSSCASGAAAPAGSSWSPTSSATPTRADRLVIETLRRVGATHALRLGRPNLRAGFVELPRVGPILTWRAVCDHGPPPLPNWDLRLGDVELF